MPIMKRYVSSQELSQNIQAVLYDIHQGSDPIFIKDDGRVQAVVVSADFFADWQEKLRKDFFMHLDTMGEKARAIWQAEGKTEEDMLELVNQTVQEYRSRTLSAKRRKHEC